MHSGQFKNYIIAFFLVILQACKSTEPISIAFESPEAGQAVKSGKELSLKLTIPPQASIRSIHYLLDGKQIFNRTNAAAVSLKTANLKLGFRLISAVVNYDDKNDTVNVNIVLLSDSKPTTLAYRVVKTFPHDTSSYTQGLSFVNGRLLESTGRNGKSFLKWVDIASGKVLQQTKLDDQYFGEGSVQVGDRIVMLTWQENIGFVFDAKTLRKLGTFPYERSKEGWGLAFNGSQILKTDGTNKIWFLNKDTFKEEDFIEVYDDQGEVKSLNEIEFIDGKIYANIYLSNKIVIIHPTTGKVEKTIDLSALVPKNFFASEDEQANNVLNGIAWDEESKRLFVTGKKWPKLFQIELAKN